LANIAGEIEKAKREAEKIEVIPVSRMILPDALVEQVWSEGRPAFQIHYFAEAKHDKIVSDIQTTDDGGDLVKYVPVDNDHLRKGSVIIPEANLDLNSASFEELWTLQDKLLDAGFDAVKQKDEARLISRICSSSWFLDKEDSGIAGMGKFAPIIPIRGVSGGGKNRLLNILRWSSYHPFYQLTTNKIPSIFRPLELWGGVLALDECDLDPERDKELVGFLLARSYGNPISRQNPNNVKESNAFNNFQLTLVTQRQGFGENALEGRSIVYYAEKSWEKLPTLETPEMIDIGKQIQKLSLALRMKYWNQIQIEKSFWLETADARLNSALLPLVAMSKFDSSILVLLNKLLKHIERRKVMLKAQSDDGVLVNYLHEKVEDGLYRPYMDGATSYVLERIEERETRDSTQGNDAKERIEIPLTTSRMKEELNWPSAKLIRGRLDGMMHLDDLPERVRLGGGKPVRAIFFRREALIKLFREFVPDFNVEKCLLGEAQGMDRFVNGVPGVPDVPHPTMPFPSDAQAPSDTQHTSGSGTSGTSGTDEASQQVKIEFPGLVKETIKMGSETYVTCKEHEVDRYFRIPDQWRAHLQTYHAEADGKGSLIEHGLRQAALDTFKRLSGESKLPVEDMSFYDEMEKMGKFTREQAEKALHDMWKSGVIFEVRAHFFKKA